MLLFFMLYNLMLSEKILMLGNFWEFWVLVFGPGVFLGFDFVPHSIFPLT